ncbi:replication initiation factor domain-containing protein [Pseudoxanthomonas winnipegensis]|nr:replication initiation factor domain-containing protein [Pseudoxanthomonas winnipegensis]
MIDWLAASFDLLAVLSCSMYGLHEDQKAVLDDLNGPVGANAPAVASAIARHFLPESFELGEVGRGRFYNWRVVIRSNGDTLGLLEFGGINTIRQDGTYTARIELTGEGCRQYEASSGNDHAQRWSLLASLLGAADARLTRIDIAADDYLGQYPVQWALERYNDGSFDRRGQRPKARLIDDMGNRTGKTLYIGSRKSEQQLRVYEKGREQGNQDSEWVRYEGEFHASNRRELPLEMLVDPAPYLVGTYPVLDFVGGIGERLRYATEKLLANCMRAVKAFRHQYGPLVNAMLHASGGDEAMLSRLLIGTARSKLPPWCPRPEDAAQLITAILLSPVGEIETGRVATGAHADTPESA